MKLMNIFKKKLWVRFYCIDAGVAELNPLFPARKLHRKWRTEALKNQANKSSNCPYLVATQIWNRINKEWGGEKNIVPEKYAHAVTCPALTSIMDAGYIIPAPADFIIKVDGTGVNFEWCSHGQFGKKVGAPRYVSAHIKQQTEGMRHLVDQTKDVLETTIKLELPWRVQAHPDVVFLQMPIAYHDEDRFTPPTGIVDPSYSYEINLQLFWHKLEEGEYLIEEGTPLCQWVPMPRSYLKMRDWDVVIETANQDDYHNNEIFDYNRSTQFLESGTLKDRIRKHKIILALNKNIKRFM